MKSLVALWACLTACLPGSAQNRMPSAEAVLKPIYTKAATQNKKVLLIFHASWCGWCDKMDSSLQDAAVKPLIDKNYLIAHLTVYEHEGKKHLEHPGALEFLTKQGGADQGIPYWMVLDGTGRVVANSEYAPGENSGCPASDVEVAYFISVLKKTSSLNERELEVIRKRFRMNDPAQAAVRSDGSGRLLQ